MGAGQSRACYTTKHSHDPLAMTALIIYLCVLLGLSIDGIYIDTGCQCTV
jgi:hypothetical protein